MALKIATQPYKGTRDFLPQDYLVLDYIFNVWREVCLKFGYKEYQTPLLESAELYRAKSGEDVGGKELFALRDLADRELALRPEMTPSVTRMVAGIYKEMEKPIRLFNISSFYRNERPQKGRNREFWQLNADIFGEDSLNTDVEILSLAIELMRAFNAPGESYTLYYSSRRLLNDFFEKILLIEDENEKIRISRLLDKYEKFDDKKEFAQMIRDSSLDDAQADNITGFLQGNIENLKDTASYQDIEYFQKAMKNLGYGNNAKFRTGIIRGFDYYDGMIFEVYDNNPENRRSLFGGGRYNGLADIFGSENFPAVGFAPGNETTRIFLENWNLLPELNRYKKFYFMPLLDESKYLEILNAANRLRRKGYRVEVDLKEQTLTSALRDANKKGYENVIIVGEEELNNNVVKIKNMTSGEQTTEEI